MRLFDTFIALLGALGLVGLAAWSVISFPVEADALESRLQAAASQAVAADGHDWASVQVDGQIAIVTGVAPSASARESALASVLASAGPGGLLFGGVTEARPDFDTLPMVSPFVWRAARTPDGEVILSGHVPSETVKSALASQAGSLGAARLDDRTEIAAGAPTGPWGEVAGLGLRAVSELDSGQARIEGSTLTVAGLSMDDAVRARLSASVANVDPPFTGQPDIRGPSLWSARLVGEDFILDGDVASEDERTEILQIARAHFDGNIIDEMNVGGQRNGRWIEGVRLGLPHFASFTRGWMGLAPSGDAFDIEGAASGSTLTYLAEDMARLGDEFDVRIAAEQETVAIEEIATIDFSLDPRAACESAFDAVLESNQVVFANASAEISRDSGAALDKIMAVAGRCEPQFIFELGGHTDSVGDRSVNLALSQNRAQAVANYMMERGFEADRLRIVGYGPDRPVAENATPEGRAANRRLEFKVQEQDVQ